MSDDLLYDMSAERLRAAIRRPRTLQGKLWRLIPAKSAVLDIGCHTGGFGALLMENGCQVTGIERNLRAAERAKKVLSNVIIGDLEEPTTWRELHDKFNVILCLDVLEHCAEPSEILRQASSHLAADGFVLASLPNIAHWTVRRDILMGKFDYQPTGILDETHMRFFTVRSAQSLFSQSSYRIELMDFVMSAPKLFRQRIIPNVIAKRLPGLFAFQIIVKAKPLAAAP